MTQLGNAGVIGRGGAECRRKQMIDFVKGYGVLAGYVLLTQATGLNYWQVEPASRPWWILGALAVLMLAPRRRQVV